MSKPKSNKTLSPKAKLIITIAIFILAVVTVVLCAFNGMFHFEPGSVQANDEDAEAVMNNTDKDEEEENKTPTYTVFVSTGNGGSADANGNLSVEEWGSATINFTPDEGYEIQDVRVDGESVGAVSSYTLSYITEDHSIVALFSPIPEPEEDEDADDEDGLFGLFSNN